MEQIRIPKPGEIYKHFKGNLYQIITVAMHTELNELMVVYQALYGDFKTYIRPLEMFISEVDHIKYPKVKQKYRFELKVSSEDLVKVNDEPSYYSEKNGTELKKSDTFVTKVNDVTGSEINNSSELNSEVNNNELNNNELNNNELNNNEVINKIVFNRELQSNTVQNSEKEKIVDNTVIPGMEVNALLLKFLDAESYTKKLEVLTTNKKHITDRIINDMAVALDCTVDEGPIDRRIQDLVSCLEAKRRFEDRRFR